MQCDGGRPGKGVGRVTILWKSALAFGRSNVTPREFFPMLSVVIDVPHTGFRYPGIVAVDRCAGDSLLTTTTSNQSRETMQHAPPNATLRYKIYTQVFREIRDPVFRKRVCHFDPGGRVGAQMGAEKASKCVAIGGELKISTITSVRGRRAEG